MSAHHKDPGNEAKAVAVARLEPGEGRAMATEIIGAEVKLARKAHPEWSEAKAWDYVLEHSPHAIATYTRGELAEQTTRRRN